MGQGNNRCATSSQQTPLVPVTPGATQAAGITPQPAVPAATVQQSPSPTPSSVKNPGSSTSPGTGAESPEATQARSGRQLPFTGLDAALLALVGLMLCGLSLVVRTGARRVSL
jgi:hypothetical protein